MKITIFAMGLIMVGCATYDHAQNVRIISFSEDMDKGRSVGTIRGEECSWQVLGYQLSSPPTVDKAVMRAQTQTDGSRLIDLDSTNRAKNESLRYINNVSTKNEGFNAGLFGKHCLIVTGVGYR